MKKLRIELLPLAFILGLLGAGSLAHAEVINGHDWVLNLEYRQLTDDSPPFSRHVWVCDAELPGNCENSTAWDALSPEAGWEVAPARVRLWDVVVSILPPPPEGLPAVLNFGGYTLNYGAEVIEGTIISFGPVFATASVERQTVLTFNAGTVVHEVTDPNGFRYTLFTAEVGVAEAYDLTQEGSLDSLAFPSGWTYSSRTLTDDFPQDSNGLAIVFVGPGTSWQRSNDLDRDGVFDEDDNCPSVPNEDQTNSDLADDGGDACDDDDDNDLICDENVNITGVCIPGAGSTGGDNCRTIPNNNQADIDLDYSGDVCDNCPADFNPNQADKDGNGIGNVCDPDYVPPPAGC
jgi:hypothetical protein